MNIIYPSTIEWEGGAVFQRPQQLMWAFAEQGHHVVFLEIGRTQDSFFSKGVEVCGLDNMAPLPEGQTVVWFTHPPYYSYGDLLKANFVVFDYIDEAIDEFSEWQNWFEPAILHADLITVVSERLYDIVSVQYPDKPVLLLPNAADFSFFQDARSLPTPADMARLPRPIVGFYGSISTWIDLDFTVQLAKHRPDVSFVLIGPDTVGAARRLANSPNIYLLGRKWYHELPAYAGSFDVAFIPFQVRNMTHSSSPIKMYEHLAAGLPVLCTCIQEAVNCPPVFTSNDLEAWSREMDRLFAEGLNQAAVDERQSYALEHAWSARVKQVVNGLTELNEPNPHPTINTEAYWNRRFKYNWEQREGREQTHFFMQTVIDCLPEWIKRDIRDRRLRICDAGCATGDGVLLLAEAFKESEVVGIDFAEKAIRRARELHPQHHYQVGDLTHLNEHFDVIVTSNTLEHFANPVEVIDQLLAHTHDYLLIMSPFEDNSCEPEHLSRLAYESFRLISGDFQLVHAQVISCEAQLDTRWHGQQILAVYGNAQRIPAGHFHLGAYLGH